MRIERLLLLATPPDIDAGEITDKGYLNQRAVRERRADAVELLYGEPLYRQRRVMWNLPLPIMPRAVPDGGSDARDGGAAEAPAPLPPPATLPPPSARPDAAR